VDKISWSKPGGVLVVAAILEKPHIFHMSSEGKKKKKKRKEKRGEKERGKNSPLSVLPRLHGCGREGSPIPL